MERKMVRNQLYVTVPNLFRCPISLDVMKSPVSLCTGVTYDRSSIQHWLESGHDTCPATMQILTTKEFVPNLTLHRLINLWSRQPTMPEQEVRVLIDKIKSQGENESEKGCFDCLEKIAEFASGCEENRRFLASYGGFLETIVCVLNRKREEIVVLELVVKVLNLILKENGVKEKLNQLILSSSNCLSSLFEILRKGSLDSKIQSIKILDSISLDDASKRRVLETDNFFSVLFDHLKTDYQALTDAVLSILITVTVTRSVKAQLVRLGLVQVVTNILSNSSSQIPTVEKAIKLLSIIATCSEGRFAVSEEPRCAGRVLERIMKVSKTAREDAVVMLWSMCCVYKDTRVKEEVVKSNGLTKVLLVMQSENDGIVRRMCGDLVKVLGRKNCGLGNYETKTTHIMPY
ncbi:RING-type E3 ubiquitin transferase [Melia azedarach]|uniref:RING-type E3 ubiquitin transferase n=1 Tax=Melia azedarach TaxID=155640 RepID=A0ACC1WP53_MELAZ|nr:RING-type E3 ubiquitin transferase [Melia azedarach]